MAGRFRVDELVGRGSMGMVFRAFDERLERDVAMKLLDIHFGSDPVFVARFSREAKIIAKLSSNPHVVNVYDLGDIDGHPYLVTEFDRPQPRRGGQIAFLAIAHLGSRGWDTDSVRADGCASCGDRASGSKPANIFRMSTETIPLHVKVLDFGLSHSPRVGPSAEFEDSARCCRGDAQIPVTGITLRRSGYALGRHLFARARALRTGLRRVSLFRHIVE